MRSRWSMPVVISVALLVACGSPDPEPEWAAIDIGPTASLSGVWGSASDDVFVVGGTTTQGEVHHYDGAAWSKMVVPQDTGLLVWAYGFGPNDVWSVGRGGSVLHYDGSTWGEVDSKTDQDLWGVWGASPDDIYMVGGNVFSGQVTILHWDGTEIQEEELPDEANPLDVRALFKVYGIGSRVFAVGASGLIVEKTSNGWIRHPAGSEADEDFVALWGFSEDDIVAVGGRDFRQLSTWDGTSWTTFEPSDNLGGLNAVFVTPAGDVLVGGTGGSIGYFDRDARDLVFLKSDTDLAVHAIWAGDDGVAYAVGGTFDAQDLGFVMRLEAN